MSRSLVLIALLSAAATAFAQRGKPAAAVGFPDVKSEVILIQTGQFYHDYLGKPDMNMAMIAKGFGVDGEVAHSPEELRAALGRAKKSAANGKPYLIDAQVARVGVAWADKPWTPGVKA